MSPNPDLLRAEFLGITVRHEETVRDREAAALLLARFGEAYDLNRLEYGEEGATLSGPTGSELVLRPAQTAAAGVTNLGFREGLERVLGLLEEGLSHVGADRMWIEDLTLIAVWDTEDPDGARRYLTDEVLGIDAERRELLGGDDDEEEGASHGLRVWRRLGEGALDIAVEPMHTDPSRIYLRLVYAQDEPVYDLQEVGARAEAVDAYLHGPLASFIQARARR
ncbi:MAG: hypothetical protein U0237_06400 [Thermoleophilia bacterium]